MKTSVRAQLVLELANAATMTKEQTEFFYDIFMLLIKNKLEKGETVLLDGVGRLCLATTKSSRSNLTSVTIPKHKRLSFKPNVRFARKIRIKTREHPIK